MRLRPFDRDVGLVLAAFVAALAVENVAVGLLYRREFVSSFEIVSARWHLSPVALAIAVPVAVAFVLLDRLAVAGRGGAVAFVGALGGAATAIGVSGGRRMAGLVLRVPFVVLLALLGALAGFALARVLVRTRPVLLAIGGVALAVLAWLADATVLPRLYPAFHLALFFVFLFAAAAAVRGARTSFVAGPVSIAAILLAGLAIAASPGGSRKARGEDNLRRILLEHAPFLGRGVRVAAQLAPPPPLDEDDEASRATLAGVRTTGTHAVDWRGHDIVVVTIDALRADHVSAYGYPRATTPNIDALAKQGVRFDRAYCPTPHTSYSVASLMTGKYMKPLLALSPEEDSTAETWAVQLRRYGYRTAAFYPPAVFFIDEHRFRHLRDENLGFEYAKVEFAKPELRKEQIERYLATAPKDKPLFLWVHLFEPHEPYESHPDHPFTGDPKLDAYDSEVATADALVGDVVASVGKNRPPGTVFVVSADHGEEHGDHGGRYHGTTVYEEQVRVPLVVAAPGLAPRVVTTPVQTIDLLPTSLAALEVPIPPRVRGRDLGPLLVGTAPREDDGLAFAETDDYTLVARGTDRLVCQRKIGSCTLFDIAHDPEQRSAVGDRPGRVEELRKLGAAIQRETGRLEATGLPEALRRAMQGDRDAAEDVAPLLDDAKVDLRRLAARAAYALRAPEVRPQLERALAHDEDDVVRHWCALAIVRTAETDDKATRKIVEDLLRSGTAEEKLAAAQTLAERGDARGEGELVARWNAAFGPDATQPGEPAEARELLGAFTRIKSRASVPLLVRALEDVELRPYVVTALADIGDARAKAALVKQLTEERYVHLRPLEARALLKLGGRHELFAPLARFAGVPEPMQDALAIAREGRLVTYDRGGKDYQLAPPRPATKGDDTLKLELPFAKPPGMGRLLLALDPGRTTVTGTVNGAPLPEGTLLGESLYVIELGELKSPHTQLVFNGRAGIQAAWLVPRSPEIPPPAPRAWKGDAGADGLLPASGAPGEGL